MSEIKTTEIKAITAVVGQTGAKESTKKLLVQHFGETLIQLQEWQEKAKAINVTDESEVQLMKAAKEARLILKKMRTTADAKRKELKEEALIYNKAIQEVYNIIRDAITPIETHLKEQEDFITLERQREAEALANSRAELLEPYAGLVPANLPLAEMSEEEFNNTLEGAKLLKESQERKAAEEAERQRQKEEAEEKERQRIAEENKRLRAEKEEADRIAEGERQKRLAVEAEQRAKEEVQRQENERLEAERKAKEEEERKAEEKRRREEEKAVESQRIAEAKANAAPDNMKVIRYITQLEEVSVPEVKDLDSLSVLSDIEKVLRAYRIEFTEKVS